jgi:hypothetical protein
MPEDIELVLNLAEVKLAELRRRIDEDGVDRSFPECLHYRQFKLDVLWAVALLKDRQDEDAITIRARVSTLLDKHRTLLGHGP